MFSDSIEVHTASLAVLPTECETRALIKSDPTARSSKYWPPAPIDLRVILACAPPHVSVVETLIPSALTPKVSALAAFDPKSMV